MQDLSSGWRRSSECFEDYFESHPPEDLTCEHLVMEARDLLGQLDPLMREIDELNLKLTRKTEDMLLDPDLDWPVGNPNRETESDTRVLTMRGKVSEPNSPTDETKLSQLTRRFYEDAHRLGKILKFKCREVSIVRNQLLVHPEEQGSVITLHSFGWGAGGPEIKPIRAAGQHEDHHDKGLFHNADAFQKALRRALCTD